MIALNANRVVLATILLALLFVCTSHANGEKKGKSQIARLFDFNHYKEMFNKQYSGVTEELVRKKLFLAKAYRALVSGISYKFRKSSYYLALNTMSDRTREELDRKNPKFLEPEPKHNYTVINLPHKEDPDLMVESMDEIRAGIENFKEIVIEMNQTEIAEELNRMEKSEVDSSEKPSNSTKLPKQLKQPKQSKQSKQPKQSKRSKRSKRSARTGIRENFSFERIIERTMEPELSPESKAKLDPNPAGNNPNYKPPDINSMGYKNPFKFINKHVKKTVKGKKKHVPLHLNKQWRMEVNGDKITYYRINSKNNHRTNSNSNSNSPTNSNTNSDNDDDDDNNDDNNNSNNNYDPYSNYNNNYNNPYNNYQNSYYNDPYQNYYNQYNSYYNNPYYNYNYNNYNYNNYNYNNYNYNSNNDDNGKVYVDLSRDCMYSPGSQSSCGSCYAFAVTGFFEWLHCKKEGKLVAFSEQFIVDCGTTFFGSDLDGCSGGYIPVCADFYDEVGAELASRYPYRASKGSCPYDSSQKDEAGYIWFRNRVSKYAKVSVSSFNGYLKNGPIVLSIFSDGDFDEYGGGVHSARECRERGSDSTRHAVLLVGHGIQDGKKYWLIKNSFGTSWGERGYYKLSKSSDCVRDDSGWMFATDDGENFNLKPTTKG